MGDLHDVPFEERTRALVEQHYHAQFPLLREYDALTEQYNGQDRSINEPWTGGLDTMSITALALRRVGRPPRDWEDVAYAEQYVRRLREEMDDLYPSGPSTLTEAITRVEFSLAGCVLRADDFEDMSDQEQREHVDLLVSELGGSNEDYLREALLIALPGLYRRITAEDAERRRSTPVSPIPLRPDSGGRWGR